MRKGISDTDNEYYKLENLVPRQEDFIQFITMTPSSQIATSLRHRNKVLGEINTEMVRSWLSSRARVLDNGKQIPGHEVLFDSSSADGLQFHIQYQLLDQKLFMIAMRWARPMGITKKDKKDLITQLKLKYPELKTNAEGYLDMVVQDADGHQLFVMDDVNFYTGYIINQERIGQLRRKYITDGLINNDQRDEKPLESWL